MLQNKTIRAISLIIAGGGTGGHLFPGIAVAEEVLAAGLNSHVRFIGTGNRFETGVLNGKGFEQQHIRVQSLKGKTMVQQIKALAFLPWSVLTATWILRKFRPDVVLGVGGYSAGPVVVARLVSAHSPSTSRAERDSRHDQPVCSHILQTGFTCPLQTPGSMHRRKKSA